MERHRGSYCYWAFHGAYYYQWPYYDYRIEFDYPWFAHPRPSMWRPPCLEAVYGEPGILPPQEFQPGYGDEFSLQAAPRRPPRVTRIGPASSATSR